ncbi:cytochrome c oxidase subunit I [Limoniibacter endophyticus]|uniref:cytochrome-c oxidase n=1 Tax=Limoniibacter endophyticus TaxID=1565040 RepID=A0A8J3DQL4_9HYPH|nr:cytochrome c oxidase subunit I [Limoniibacter endophyticus]GHC72454.1 cytochrome ubiquinol oxidase subunit I [Limoniibacter endophyticus]
MRHKEQPTSAIALHKALDRVWATKPGWGRFAAVNHNVVGKRFMLTALVFFAIGGTLGMLIRTQLATSGSAFMEAGQYAQVFTMHGTIMMFLFAIPFFEGMAMYLLPKLLGTRDLAFPRLSAYGYWCYLFGGSILLVALLFGIAPAGGWFMYTPLSSSAYSPGINPDIWLLGITFVEISALSAAVEMLVSILKVRAPGMRLERMPIFAWYMLIVAGMMLIGFPPLILGSILLELERAFGLPFFDPERGGDPLLWQHLFWLFGHPEVYIIFLPAAGAISTILPVLFSTHLLGYRAIIVALLAMAFLSLGLWVHHMYTVGIPHVALSFFSAASALVTIPTAVQIFAWLGTMARGRPRFSIPMLHIFGFFFVFVIGGLTGVMLAMVPFDWQAHDTHFVVAHLHYVLVGGFIFPMLAAAYYWLPHIAGKQSVQHLSHAAFWMVFVGFNLTFFIMHLTGLRGMPRRVYAYPPESGWEVLNLVSSVGSFVMAMGFALIALDFILLFRFGKRYHRNPWKAGTLEWAMPTPPPPYNFAAIPHVTDAADKIDVDVLGNNLAAGNGYLGRTREGHMEVLGVDIVSGKPDQVVILPKQSSLPLWTAIATGLFFVAMLLKLYWVAPVALVVVVGLFLRWTRDPAVTKDQGPLDIGMGEMAPSHLEARSPPSLLGMQLILTANAVAYAALIFGSLFLWLSAPNWPAAQIIEPGLIPILVGVVALFGASFSAARTRECSVPHLRLTALCHVIATAAAALVIANYYTMAFQHAAYASIFVVAIYGSLHSLLGIVFALFGIWRITTGYISKARNVDLRIGLLWHRYTAIAGAIAFLFAPFLTMLKATAGGL